MRPDGASDRHVTGMRARKVRLDRALVARGLLPTRSQAESYVRLGRVTAHGEVITEPGTLVTEGDRLALQTADQYVSRAGLKLASVAAALHVDVADKIVLDVGSSTGGFTDYALQHGARKVVAVDIGTRQLHPRLRLDPRIELHEKTDILQVVPRGHTMAKNAVMIDPVDIVVADVSFVSLRQLLPHIARLMRPQAELVAMVKPQFEADGAGQKHAGIIKNDHVRRDILKSFEEWARTRFVIVDKADSAVPGSKGNRERFYLLRPVRP